MLLKTVTKLVVGAICLTTIAALPGITAEAATNGGHSGYTAPAGSPQQNIRHSERYDRLVATDPAFRRSRMRIECGPISDPVLHWQCIQSFQHEVQAWRDGQLQAFYGSSTAPQNYGSASGQ